MKAMDDIVLLIAWRHGLTLRQITEGRNARGAIAEARREAMWRLRQERRDNGRCRFSLKQVASYMGLKDHASVHEQASKHEAMLAPKRAA